MMRRSLDSIIIPLGMTDLQIMHLDDSAQSHQVEGDRKGRPYSQI